MWWAHYSAACPCALRTQLSYLDTAALRWLEKCSSCSLLAKQPGDEAHITGAWLTKDASGTTQQQRSGTCTLSALSTTS